MMLWEILLLTTTTLAGCTGAIYLGYYLYILRASKKRQKEQTDPDFRPRITVIVPTYNDAQTINDKLVNLVEQTYPNALMEILMIDSASKDKTVDIEKRCMSSHPELRMKLIVEEERRGKSTAINRALSNIDPQSEIVLMTDANAFLDKNAVQTVVERFSNPEIGSVVGKQVMPPTDRSCQAQSESAYLGFYQKMRHGESLIDSTPIFDGELSAYRTKFVVGKKIRENLNADDSQLAIMARREGYKSVFEPDALFYEPLPSNRHSLRMMKVRRGQGLARLFWYNKDIMFNRSYGKFGSTIMPANFFMHLVSPFIILSLIVLTVTTALLYVFQTAQPLALLVLLGLVLLAILVEQALPTRTKISKVAATFLQYQLILVEGMIRFLTGDSLHKWQKVQKKTY
ncbi:glycosyltransferase [Candidatus Bathyarchaeota archaeon]|nr:glycosyltransferase [Candidatus Bathyarchaeota archaeon]